MKYFIGCDPCDKPGHICDPLNGRCVCPPYTTGSRCQKCVRNAWGYDPIKGCKVRLKGHFILLIYTEINIINK